MIRNTTYNRKGKPSLLVILNYDKKDITILSWIRIMVIFTKKGITVKERMESITITID